MQESKKRLTVADVLERIDENRNYYTKQAYRELEVAMNLGKAQKYDEGQEHIGKANTHMGAVRALEEMSCFIRSYENDEQE